MQNKTTIQGVEFIEDLSLISLCLLSPCKDWSMCLMTRRPTRILGSNPKQVLCLLGPNPSLLGPRQPPARPALFPSAGAGRQEMESGEWVTMPVIVCVCSWDYFWKRHFERYFPSRTQLFIQKRCNVLVLKTWHCLASSFNFVCDPLFGFLPIGKPGRCPGPCDQWHRTETGGLCL